MTLDRCIVSDCREVMRDLIASGVKVQKPRTAQQGMPI